MMGKLLLPVLALTALAGPASAQDYPTRIVQWVFFCNGINGFDTGD